MRMRNIDIGGPIYGALRRQEPAKMFQREKMHLIYDAIIKRSRDDNEAIADACNPFLSRHRFSERTPSQTA